ncbi:MAG: hypothetical protein RBT16_12445, partial [Desulfococcus multivorans]|nr:hypothetical protein [Desulfococcus multivorans]
EFIFRKFLELEKRLEEYAAYGLAARDELAEGISAAKSEVGQKVDSLAAESAGRGREFLLLRYALLVLNNRGFFGSIRLPSEKGIERLVRMKKEEPGLSMEEAGARLKAEGIEMSGKEVFLVFSVYFNEFK